MNRFKAVSNKTYMQLYVVYLTFNLIKNVIYGKN
jgi:hypothetical protein